MDGQRSPICSRSPVDEFRCAMRYGQGRRSDRGNRRVINSKGLHSGRPSHEPREDRDGNRHCRDPRNRVGSYRDERRACLQENNFLGQASSNSNRTGQRRSKSPFQGSRNEDHRLDNQRKILDDRVRGQRDRHEREARYRNPESRHERRRSSPQRCRRYRSRGSEYRRRRSPTTRRRRDTSPNHERSRHKRSTSSRSRRHERSSSSRSRRHNRSQSPRPDLACTTNNAREFAVQQFDYPYGQIPYTISAGNLTPNMVSFYNQYLHQLRYHVPGGLQMPTTSGHLLLPALPFGQAESSLPATSVVTAAKHQRPANSQILHLVLMLENNQLVLEGVSEKIIGFCKDKNGAVFIQVKLSNGSDEDKEIIFQEILKEALVLMQDMYGNYVIQKLLEVETQQEILVSKMEGHVLVLAENQYGCRVLQKALELVPTGLKIQIAQEFRGHVHKCVEDQNATHVIQKIVSYLEPSDFNFVVDELRGRMVETSVHPYGSRLVQLFFDHCAEIQKNSLLEEIHSNSIKIMQNKFGNYVIQKVVKQGSEDRARIARAVLRQLTPLAMQKFASKVIEKCLELASEKEMRLFFEIICEDCNLYPLSCDRYGNYIVQKMFERANEQQKKKMFAKLRSRSSVLSRYPAFRIVVDKMEAYFNNFRL